MTFRWKITSPEAAEVSETFYKDDKMITCNFNLHNEAWVTFSKLDADELQNEDGMNPSHLSALEIGRMSNLVMDYDNMSDEEQAFAESVIIDEGIWGLLSDGWIYHEDDQLYTVYGQLTQQPVDGQLQVVSKYLPQKFSGK